MIKRCAIGSLIVIMAGLAHAESFIIVPSQSTVSFRVRGLFGKVKGKFEKFEGAFVYEPNQPQLWNAAATIETASIRTGIHRRDKDLQKADFFNVETYPTMTFTSTGATQSPGEKPLVSGNLTIRGITRPVVLTIESVELTQNGSGQQIAHAIAITRIARKDFGVGAHHGTFLIGKTVEIRLDVQGIPKPAN